ncbi:MAG TPA: CDP-alcohol phosphatidyltransferase family protein [Clostridiales bacterium]|nr:CDP-alcohol phosphatidyltransferase family protein [Clostridiales bacterium]
MTVKGYVVKSGVIGGESIKNIPNCITIIRIFAAVSLLFVKPFSALFFFFYFMCGISDVLDGYIARKMDASSKLGQVLDSISDLIFVSIVLLIFIPIMTLPLWIIYWVAAIAAVRLISIILGLARYRQLAFLHTYANKATGIVLFLFPFLISVSGKEITAIIICCIASISTAEELLINLTSRTLHRDRGSIFSQ